MPRAPHNPPPPAVETPDHYFVRVVPESRLGATMNEAYRLGYREVQRRRLPPVRRGARPRWLVEGERIFDACPLCGAVPEEAEEDEGEEDGEVDVVTP